MHSLHEDMGYRCASYQVPEVTLYLNRNIKNKVIQLMIVGLGFPVSQKKKACNAYFIYTYCVPN